MAKYTDTASPITNIQTELFLIHGPGPLQITTFVFTLRQEYKPISSLAPLSAVIHFTIVNRDSVTCKSQTRLTVYFYLFDAFSPSSPTTFKVTCKRCVRMIQRKQSDWLEALHFISTSTDSNTFSGHS